MPKQKVGKTVRFLVTSPSYYQCSQGDFSGFYFSNKYFPLKSQSSKIQVSNFAYKVEITMFLAAPINIE